jgi:amidase
MLLFNLARRSIGEFFERYDVLVTPTLAVPAIALGTLDCSSFATVEEFRDASERTVFTFTAPFNVTGQPAVSLPIGMTTAGTPVGVQLVARFGEEEVLLRLAAAFEELRPWRGRVAAVHAASARHSGPARA